jgi:hypothetical protein
MTFEQVMAICKQLDTLDDDAPVPMTVGQFREFSECVRRLNPGIAEELGRSLLVEAAMHDVCKVAPS